MARILTTKNEISTVEQEDEIMQRIATSESGFISVTQISYGENLSTGKSTKYEQPIGINISHIITVD